MKIKITRNKVIAFIAIAALLALSFWYGGNAPGLQGWNVSASGKNSGDSAGNAEVSGDLSENDGQEPGKGEGTISDADADTEQNHDENDTEAETVPEAEKPSEVTENGESANEPAPPAGSIGSRPGGTEAGLTADEKVALAKEMAGGSSSPGVMKGSKEYSESSGMVIDEKTGKDKYLTAPVPEGKPVPVEPDNVEISDVEHKCTLSVRCDTILDNIDWLDPEKTELVPEDGVVFPATEVTFYEGESVFNILQREMKKAKIHMEFEDTPIYNSAYIEGINNLYEFDCGELSGWMYKVNGWFPNYGCSRYQLKDGDVIEWVYTCDLGVDVGGYYSAVGE